MKKRILLLLALMCLGAGIVKGSFKECMCQFLEDGRPYIAISGSPVWHDDHFFKDNTGIAGRDYHVGYGVQGSVGRTFPNYCMRGELEVLYHYNSLKSESAPGLGVLPAQGHTRDLAVMLNVIKDMPMNEEIMLHVGVGAGISFNEHCVESVNNVPVNIDVNDELFAWNLMAGTSLKFWDNIVFTGQYRFFGTTKVQTSSGLKSEDLPFHHSVDFGIRMHF